MLHLFKQSEKLLKMDFKFTNQLLTTCKQYCLAAGATQGNIAYTRNVMVHSRSEKEHLIIITIMRNDSS